MLLLAFVVKILGGFPRPHSIRIGRSIVWHMTATLLAAKYQRKPSFHICRTANIEITPFLQGGVKLHLKIRIVTGINHTLFKNSTQSMAKDIIKHQACHLSWYVVFVKFILNVSADM